MAEGLNERLVKSSRHAPDMVNHPPHYTEHPAGIECIHVTRHANFNLGNAIKYIWRVMWGKKSSPVEDLKKAVWYLQDEIKRREAHATNQTKG